MTPGPRTAVVTPPVVVTSSVQLSSQSGPRTTFMPMKTFCTRPDELLPTTKAWGDLMRAR